jgi:hypothetical protein
MVGPKSSSPADTTNARIITCAGTQASTTSQSQRLIAARLSWSVSIFRMGAICSQSLVVLV